MLIGAGLLEQEMLTVCACPVIVGYEGWTVLRLTADRLEFRGRA